MSSRLSCCKQMILRQSSENISGWGFLEKYFQRVPVGLKFGIAEEGTSHGDHFFLDTPSDPDHAPSSRRGLPHPSEPTPQCSSWRTLSSGPSGRFGSRRKLFIPTASRLFREFSHLFPGRPVMRAKDFSPCQRQGGAKGCGSPGRQLSPKESGSVTTMFRPVRRELPPLGLPAPVETGISLPAFDLRLPDKPPAFALPSPAYPQAGPFSFGPTTPSSTSFQESPRTTLRWIR